MNKIYCWFPKKTASGEINVGHASMDIAFGQGRGLAEYVSWWPLKPAGVFNAFEAVPGGVSSYPDDVKLESGEPDRMVAVDCLDEKRMRDRWLMVERRAQFILFYRNCAHTVAEVLLYGGAILAHECRQFAAQRVLWTPPEVITFANVINQNADTIRKARADKLTYKSRLFTTRQWVPLPYRIQYQ